MSLKLDDKFSVVLLTTLVYTHTFCVEEEKKHNFFFNRYAIFFASFWNVLKVDGSLKTSVIVCHTQHFTLRDFSSVHLSACVKMLLIIFFLPFASHFFSSSAPFTPIMFSSVQHQHHCNRRIDFSCFSHTQLQTEETDVCVPV